MFLLLALAACQSGCYVLTQAYHQGKLYSQKQPISEVITSSDTPAPVQQRLRWSQDIVKFAEEQGLNVDGAYDQYIETSNKPVSHIVYAAAPDKLESKTWWFPIVGTVPYLGFFDRAERDEEAEELKSEGYDVGKGAVGAFSTLGWFSDPIFRSMLERSHAELAHLLFHELTHRTFWVSGNAEFNEQIAEFVGHKLAMQYLEQKHLRDELEDYLNRQEDQKTFHLWLSELRAELDRLFANKTLTKEQILASKEQLYRSFLTNKKPSFKTDEFEPYFKKEWNNAVLLGIALYDLDVSVFEEAYACLKMRNVGEFLRKVENLLDDEENPEKMLRQQCEKAQGEK
ncbi:MAG: aminopeptidase [Oligoflexales bacterium]